MAEITTRVIFISIYHIYIIISHDINILFSFTLIYVLIRASATWRQRAIIGHNAHFITYTKPWRTSPLASIVLGVRNLTFYDKLSSSMVAYYLNCTHITNRTDVIIFSVIDNMKYVNVSIWIDM